MCNRHSVPMGVLLVSDKYSQLTSPTLKKNCLARSCLASAYQSLFSAQACKWQSTFASGFASLFLAYSLPLFIRGYCRVNCRSRCCQRSKAANCFLPPFCKAQKMQNSQMGTGLTPTTAAWVVEGSAVICVCTGNIGSLRCHCQLRSWVTYESVPIESNLVYRQPQWREISITNSGQPKGKFLLSANNRKTTLQTETFLPKYRKNRKRVFLPKETLSVENTTCFWKIIS